MARHSRQSWSHRHGVGGDLSVIHNCQIASSRGPTTQGRWRPVEKPFISDRTPFKRAVRRFSRFIEIRRCWLLNSYIRRNIIRQTASYVCRSSVGERNCGWGHARRSRRPNGSRADCLEIETRHGSGRCTRRSRVARRGIQHGADFSEIGSRRRGI